MADVNNMPRGSDLSDFIAAVTGEKYDPTNRVHAMMFELSAAWSERRVGVALGLIDSPHPKPDWRSLQSNAAHQRELTLEEKKHMEAFYPGRYDFRR